MDAPVRMDGSGARAFGLAAPAWLLPVPGRRELVPVGLDAAASKFRAAKQAARPSGRGFVPATAKVHSLVGPVAGIRDFVRLWEPEIGAEAAAEAFRPVRGDFEAAFAGLVPGGIRAGQGMPVTFFVASMVMGFVARGLEDHARLVLRWPYLAWTVDAKPEILDRAAAGESLWDVLAEVEGAGGDRAFRSERAWGVSAQEVHAAVRRLRGVDEDWLPEGVPFGSYVRKLAAAASHLPRGMQVPSTPREAEALVGTVSFYHGVLHSLGLVARREALDAILANAKAWKAGGCVIGQPDVADFVNRVMNGLLTPAFVLNDVADPTDMEKVKAFLAVLGSDPGRTAEASKGWHREFLRRRREMTREPVAAVHSWPAAFPEIEVPARAVEGRSVRIVPLLTTAQLVSEGASQKHCVGSMSNACASGRQRIFSVREGGVTLSTCAVAMRDGRLLVDQHRAARNGDPCEVARLAVAWFEGCVNGPDVPFPFEREWPDVIPKIAADRKTVEEDMLEAFLELRRHLPPKVASRGIEGVLAVCRR